MLIHLLYAILFLVFLNESAIAQDDVKVDSNQKEERSMNALETTKKMFDAWNKRDWDTIRNAIHPECVYTGPDGKQTRGIEDCLAAAWKDFAAGFPDGRVEPKAFYVQGNVVVTEFTLKATHTGEWEGIAPTGKTVEVDFCNIMEFKDGKVFKERDYVDTLGLFVQLGVVQMPE
jgi:steroid delta-isomerase-like uncharacterized protein